MSSEFQQGMAENSAGGSPGLNQWQKIQDLFAGIIGINLWLVSAQGTPLSLPSKICTYCSDLNSSNYSSTQLSDCTLKTYQFLRGKNEIFYQCDHSVTYFFFPLKESTQHSVWLMGGPFVMGKKESEEDYRFVCQKLGLDYDHFMDWIRELKICSHNGINLIVNFLKTLGQSIQLKEPEISKTASQVADSLLEVASDIVGADSGSVLLVNDAKDSFTIQSSHGMNPEISATKNIPFKDGIAEWVAENKQPVLINSDQEGVIPRAKLKRAQIKTSMVIPLNFQDHIYGVFCLNAQATNEKFNEENLSFLNHLGRIASAAFSQFVPN